MIVSKKVEKKTPKFQSVQLKGGPHDGQMMQVPADQADVELIEGDTRHTYHRLSHKPVLHHDGDLTKLIGGKA